MLGNKKKIIQEVMNGNTKYHVKLMNMFNPEIYRTARYYLYSAYNRCDDIEDAVQEVWIKVFKYIDLLEAPEKFPAWVNKIMKNQCLNMQKKNMGWKRKY